MPGRFCGSGFRQASVASTVSARSAPVPPLLLPHPGDGKLFPPPGLLPTVFPVIPKFCRACCAALPPAADAAPVAADWPLVPLECEGYRPIAALPAVLTFSSSSCVLSGDGAAETPLPPPAPPHCCHPPFSPALDGRWCLSVVFKASGYSSRSLM